MDLVLALNYSGRWDLMNAVRQIGWAVKNGQLDPDSVTEQTVSGYLSTAGMPDPELLIRTSGEHRVSNFLLWESAYTEFYFTECYWPDFRREHLFEAIVNYQNRERRFGGIGQKVH
jgi:undecaprenyl diphosphate synthase